MKTILTTFLLALMTTTVAIGQTGSPRDYDVIDKIYENYQDMQASYTSANNALFIQKNKPHAIHQITEFVKGKHIKDLHIYVNCKPGSMVFNSIGITPERVDEFSSEFTEWQKCINGHVIIHSEQVFSGDHGQKLKNKLQQASNLSFITASD